MRLNFIKATGIVNERGRNYKRENRMSEIESTRRTETIENKIRKEG